MRAAALLVSLTVALSTVGSPPAAVRTAKTTGGTEASSVPELVREAHGFWKRADYARAAELYQDAFREDFRTGRIREAVRRLSDLAGCRLAVFEYRRALEAYLEARRLARERGYALELGAISLNLSALYLQIWDLTASIAAAQEGLEAVRTLSSPPFYQSHLLLHLATLHSWLGDDGKAEDYFRKSAAAAANGPSGDPSTEARARDQFGEALVRLSRLDEGESELMEALRLREAGRSRDLGFSYARVAELKLARGELREAQKFSRKAMDKAASGEPSLPPYMLHFLRGRIHRASGNQSGALDEFRRAEESALRWRIESLPADTFRVSSSSSLYERIVRALVETVMDRGLRRGDQALIREGLEVLSRWRAASLLESLDMKDAWRRRVNPEYWETLAQLRKKEARRMIRPGTDLEVDSLRLKLAEQEALATGVKQSENIRSQNSLIQLQAGLRKEDVLLDVFLADTSSYLWVVTTQSFKAYRLPPRERVLNLAGAFRDAVRNGSAGAEELGIRLYDEMFGQLSPEIRAKPAWNLILDEALFETPFAALKKPAGGRREYLIESHSIQVAPSAWWLTAQPRRREGRFGDGSLLAVGDPIYNTADPRWSANRWWRPAPLTDTTIQVGRLAGSAREVSTAAQAWRGESAVLTGSAATHQAFTNALSPRTSAIHLATHVLSHPKNRSQSLILFSLAPNGEPDVMTTADVGTLNVGGALVTLSGCHTAAGDTRSGAGAIGLARAWLLAGAAGVVTTAWPVSDSAGEIFGSFYRNLGAMNPAESLRQAQIAAVKQGGIKGHPKTWAAYVLTGGGH